MEVEDRSQYIEIVTDGGHADEQVHAPPTAAGLEEHIGPSPVDHIFGDDQNRSGLPFPLGISVHLSYDRHQLHHLHAGSAGGHPQNRRTAVGDRPAPHLHKRNPEGHLQEHPLQTSEEQVDDGFSAAVDPDNSAPPLQISARGAVLQLRLEPTPEFRLLGQRCA